MSPLRLVRKYVGYVRAGYPPEAPAVGYSPLMALMGRPTQGGGAQSDTTARDATM